MNELLEIFVSVPPKVAEPVVENTPACSGTKFTVTSRVWPPGRLARLQVRVPPNEPCATPPQVPWLPAAESNWKLEGRGSVKTTFCAVALPVLFLICQVKVSPVPWFGPPLRAEPTTCISALAPPPVPPPITIGVVTLVVELARLFPTARSGMILPRASFSWTAAVFVIAVFPATTVTVTLACAPASNAPKVQLKLVPVCVQTPCDVVEAWKAPGSESLSVTSAASPGPLLVIVMEKVTNAPALTLPGEDIVMAMSAPCGEIGVTALDGSDGALLPVALVARTVNEYVVPLVKPVKLIPV